MPRRRSMRPRVVPVSEQRIAIDDHLDEMRSLLATAPPEDPLQRRAPVVVGEPTATRGLLARRWAYLVDGLGPRAARGRELLLAGGVLDLQVQRGLLLAEVQGTRRYRVKIVVALPVGELHDRLRAGLAGAEDRTGADLLPTMLRLDDAVFPPARHLVPLCPCLDDAPFCKHVCAALHGFGVRLDDDPGLLLLLRGLTSDVPVVPSTPVLAPLPAAKQLHADLAQLFGIELLAAPASVPAPVEPASGPADLAPELRASTGLPEVGREYLRTLGVPTHTIDAWLREGVLHRTQRHGIYERTPEANRRISAYLPSDEG